jgi:pimeloyl-ACP methyl ester carboxylesterase
MLPVILLPGLACDANLWHAQLPALAARHWVHVSNAHTRAATLPAMAQHLLDGLPTREPVVLVGSSMGAMLALHVQRLAPERVRAMALLSTSARADTPELVKLRGDAIELFEQGRAAEVLETNAAFAFHPEHAKDDELVRTYIAEILRAGPAQLVAQNRALMAGPDLRAGLPLVRCPVLVACGSHDYVTPLPHSREIAEAIPGARLEVVERAGHLMTWEQPDAVNALLLGWLATLP